VGNARNLRILLSDQIKELSKAHTSQQKTEASTKGLTSNMMGIGVANLY